MPNKKLNSGYVLLLALIMVCIITLIASAIAYWVAYANGKKNQEFISKAIQLPSRTVNTSNTVANQTAIQSSQVQP